LSGTTATYANVKPGVDLVVQAIRTGYEQSFVIRDAAALSRLQASAGAGGLVSWSLPVKTKGLTAQAEADGSVSFVDAKNVMRSMLHAPAAWDAQIDPRSGDHESTAPVKLSVAQKSKGRAIVTITPDQGWLADPARVFPITIDPTYTSGILSPNFDTYVQSGYVADLSTSTQLKVGTYDGGVHVTRSFLNFPLASIHGKQIEVAYLSLAQNWSNSCTPSAFNVYSSAVATTSARWAAQPVIYPTVYGTLSTAKGFSAACPTARISVPITSFVQAMAGTTSATDGVALRAASETDSNGWKIFGSLESTAPPYISYTYNQKPNAGSTPTIANVGTYNGMDYPWKPQPVLSSIATDPDGNTVRSTIEVHSSTTTSASTLKSSCVTPYVASGATGSCTAAVLADNTTLYARSAVVDDQGLWNGTWSAWKTFKTAQTPPPTPGISCPGYTNGSWTDTVPTADVTCTITSAGAGNNTATTLTPTIDGVAQAPKATGQVVYSFTLTVPKTAGGHIVQVVAKSASTLTTTAQIGFGYGNASLTTPAAAPRVTTSGAIKIAASGPPRGASPFPTAKVRWRVAGSGSNELVGWNDATTAPLTVTDSVPNNGTSPLAVTGTWNTASETQDSSLDSDPNTTGVQPTVLNPRVPVLLDVQVCLTYTAGTQCTWSSTKTGTLRVPHAFGNGFPTTTAGPGQVALFTGEFNTSATDVTVPGYTGALTVSRSHSTFGNSTAAAADPSTAVFGPGWTAQLEGSDVGNAGLQVADGTGLDGTMAFIDAEGSALVFSTPTGDRRTTIALPTGKYSAVDEDTKTSGTTLAVALVGPVTTLTLTDEDGTTTTFTALAEPTSATTQVNFGALAVTEPANVGATSYTRDPNTKLVTRILAPVPPGVTCPAYPATLNAGCRALRIVYATTSTATSTIPGDIAGQVSGIWLDIYDPAKAGGAGMTSTQVATYKYDASKRLVSQSDPRSNVAATTYAYDTNNHLTQVGSDGLTPYTLTYTGAGPKLASVTRARPAGDPAGGTATLANFIYDVPRSGTGLPDLSQTAVTKWGQVAAPTYAAAVFGPDYTGSLTSPDYTYADLSYTDTQGYTTNTANYGAGAWQRTSADYDTHGNVIRVLDARALAKVVADAQPGEADQLATSTVYNPIDVTAADGTLLTAAGSLLTDTYGPVRRVSLNDASIVNARPHTHTSYDQLAPAATNPATGVPYHLPTTVTVAAADPGTLADLSGQVLSQTLTGYDPIDGGSSTGTTSGWTLGQATTSTTDMDLSGDITTGDITTRTRYDDTGRAVEARQPSVGGATTTPDDAGVSLTAYYTAAAQAAPNNACGGTPQWAGLPCHTYPAANPTPGAAGAGTLPDSTIAGYNYMLSTTSVVETSGSATRSGTMTYRSDGRVDTSRTTTTGLTGSVAQSGTKTGYNTTTGLATTKTKLDPVTGAITTTASITAYDSWGRQTSFTSDQGDVTTADYDAAGRVSQVTDPKGAAASTYDGTDAKGNTERRGNLTKLVVTRTGTNPATSPVLTYTGAYDASGALTTQKLPGGVTQTTTLDAAGEPMGMAYSGQVTPVDEAGNPGTPTTGNWLTWTQSNDITGRVAQEWTPGGAAFDGGPGVDALGQVQPYDTGDALGYDRTYSYDRAGRLTKVADRTAAATGTVFDPTDPTQTGTTPCNVRTYGFAGNSGLNGARSSQTSTGYDPDCATGAGGTTTRTSAYDSADRPTTGAGGSGQYTYDAFGRQITIPGVDAPNPAKGDMTLAYFDSDLPQAVTQGGITTSYALNVDGHRTVASTGPTGGASTSTTTGHYANTSDNPAWLVTDGVAARSTPSLAGDLGASIADDGTANLPLANLHGDTVTDITIPASQAETTPCTSIGAWSDYNEYGAPRDTAATTVVAGIGGYGWLGAKQRSTTVESAGLTLMGARLYNSTTGLFASTDPVPGGNANAYTYPNDPVNDSDISGNCNNARISCIRRLLTSNEAWPVGFLKFLNGRGLWAKYRHTQAGWRKMEIGRNADGCSRPASNTGFSHDFTNACATHDLGYELLRFFGWRRKQTIPGARQMIDSLFLNDMKADCRLRWLGARGPCFGTARAYYLTVHQFSRSHGYGVPD
jgi:RHS repeat-associated protein